MLVRLIPDGNPTKFPSQKPCVGNDITGLLTWCMHSTDWRRLAFAYHPIVTFSVLDFALTWGLWTLLFVLYDGMPPGPLVLLGAFGPAVAAVICVKGAGESVRGWARSLVPRTRLWWYVLALMLPVAIIVAGAPVFALVGVPVGIPSPALGGVVVHFLLALTIGGAQEEIGWRGFLMPHLQQRNGAWFAGTLVGLHWALWHAPLFILGDGAFAPTGRSFVGYVGAIIGASLILTGLFNATRGNVIVAMLYHAANNAANAFLPLGEEALAVASLVRDTAPTAKLLVVWVIVLALVLRYGRRSLAPGDQWTGTRTGTCTGLGD
ncbi:CPBP family intramembrane glutamic endopeptidase [Haloarchaeobius amylolyticus]|uniref:CPBP family intramembrane glutamic endopeptidase n=1 Tax=Haloarchaeobius amylolyticus TaxID=1198296 RepID=UPI00226E8716|nr:type II CAAX endopeptidase family protein [Haloarchaeobius amylolyticus]